MAQKSHPIALGKLSVASLATDTISGCCVAAWLLFSGSMAQNPCPGGPLGKLSVVSLTTSTISGRVAPSEPSNHSVRNDACLVPSVCDAVSGESSVLSSSVSGSDAVSGDVDSASGSPSSHRDAWQAVVSIAAVSAITSETPCSDDSCFAVINGGGDEDGCSPSSPRSAWQPSVCTVAVVSLSSKHCVEFDSWTWLASLAENANSISSCGACKCALFASNPFMISKLTSSVAGLPVVNSEPHSLLCLSSCQLVASGEA